MNLAREIVVHTDGEPVTAIIRSNATLREIRRTLGECDITPCPDPLRLHGGNAFVITFAAGVSRAEVLAVLSTL